MSIRAAAAASDTETLRDDEHVLYVDVEVRTGQNRCASTSAAAALQLEARVNATATTSSSKGFSGQIVQSLELGEGFERGSVRRYTLGLPTSVIGVGNGLQRGDVSVSFERVRVTREEAVCGEQGSGWFLDGVRVRTTSTSSPSRTTPSVWSSRTSAGAAWTHFPCRGWLGSSDCGEESGPLTRVLVPEAKQEQQLASGRWADTSVSEMPYRAVDAPWLRKKKLADEKMIEKMQASPSLRFSYGTMSLPHPDKVARGKKAHVGRSFGHCGEDAYFVAHAAATEGATGDENAGDGSLVLGVADGVYEWHDVGIDAGTFSRGLMTSARDAVMQDGVEDPITLVERAAANNTDGGIQGSSTVCIATLDPVARELRSANLGDSGYMLLAQEVDAYATSRHSPRTWHVAYRTRHQEHEFGRPYQLGHHENADSPGDVEVANVPLHDGDVLIMGSDGLFDNLHDSEMKNIVAEAIAKWTSMPTSSPPSASMTRIAIGLSRQLCLIASQRAGDKSSMSTPYALAASEAFDMAFRGGKMDDITVMVVIVSEDG